MQLQSRGIGLFFIQCLGLLVINFVQPAHSYYMPGTYPQEFKEGHIIQAQVNSLKSFDTEMPYEYYSMPFCRPLGGVKRAANTANPGTLLEGLRIENSPYNFPMKIKQTGVSACSSHLGKDGELQDYYGPLTAKEVKNLKHKIDNHYRVNMILDNLPVTVYDLLDEHQEFLRPGFELGYKDDDGKYYIYNHLVFNILISVSHGEYIAAMEKSQKSMALDMDMRRAVRRLLSDESKDLPSGDARVVRGGTRRLSMAEHDDRELSDSTVSEELYYMVVGFEVSPCSIQRDADEPIDDIICGVDDDSHIKAQEIVEGARIKYTYDVYWQESDIKWTSRWDSYLRMPGGQVHWFGIMNSVIVVLVMATLVALILIRTVRKDLTKYEQLMMDSSGLDKDEAGWKMVAGDVFRAPGSSKLLAVQIASGVQIIATSSVTLLLASLGFLSPAARGSLITVTIVAYILLAVGAGFTGVYVWGLMKRTYNGWPYICALVSIFFPGFVMVIFTILNLVIHRTGTTGAVPIGMYFSMVLVWFLISIPLTFMGGYLGVRLPIHDHPIKTNQIPRHIPPPPLAAHPVLLMFAAGVLPFGTIFIELYFAMTSVWLGFFYYLFGFVFLIAALTVVITAEVSVLCTYVQLCAENYEWWWQSFLRGGSVAIYIALYALGFLMSSTSSLTGFMPVLIYLSYMTIIILGIFFSMGTVGFAASYIFVYYIFKAVKAD